MYKIKNVLDYRYRMIPTKEEYEMYKPTSGTQWAYNDIMPLISDTSQAVVFDTIDTQKLFKQRGALNNKGIYDNKLRGWVIGSLNVELIGAMAATFGMNPDRVDFYRLLGTLIKQKFPLFVMPSEYIYTTLFRNTGGSISQYTDKITSNWATPTEDGWGIENTINTLTERFYVSLMQVVEPLYPKLVYEFSKFASVGDIFTGLAPTVEDMSSNLGYIRGSNHIDGSTVMKSANTPEIEQDISPEETINKYISSLFTTTNNKEDNLTEAMKHFEEMVNHLVGVIAYTCFIPN
jgi:hypothetical protein